MALVAHEFGLLVALVAVRTVDVAQVRVVRLGFVLGGLLSERLIAVALLADVLLHLCAFGRRGLGQVSHFWPWARWKSAV